MRKQACCLLMAMVLVVALPLTVRAAGDLSPSPWPSWAPQPTATREIGAPTPTPHTHEDPEELVIEGTDDTGTAEGTTEYIGHIVPSLVSVTVPLEVDFYINPNQEVDLTCADGAKAQVSQVLNAETAQVVNRSVVPVEVSVTATKDVTMTPGEDAKPYHDETMPDTFTLVNKLAEVGPAGTALLVLGRADVAGDGSPTACEVFPSVAEFEARALVPTEEDVTPEPISVMTVAAGDQEHLWVYGKAASDRYYGHYQFSLTTTFHVEPVKYVVVPPAETTGETPD